MSTWQGNSVPVGFINYLPHSAQSNYHALFVRVEKPFTNGFSWLASYTFSKAITNAPQFRNAGGVNGSENSPAQDAFNLQAERGLASFDARHRLVNTVVYQLPFGRNQKYLRYGAGLQGSRRMGSLRHRYGAIGIPVHDQPEGRHGGCGRGYGRHLRAAQCGSGSRPDELPASQMSTARYFNTAAFAAPATGTFGNVGRNTLIGPGFVNADAVLVASLPDQGTDGPRSSEREFFNALNHPNFNLVGRILNDPTFGQVLSQADPRELQFGFKFTF